MIRVPCRHVVAGAIVAAIASAALQAADNLPSILISRQLSESEHLATGDVVRLSDSADGSRVQQFRVAGVMSRRRIPRGWAR